MISSVGATDHKIATQTEKKRFLPLYFPLMWLLDHAREWQPTILFEYISGNTTIFLLLNVPHIKEKTSICDSVVICFVFFSFHFPVDPWLLPGPLRRFCSVTYSRCLPFGWTAGYGGGKGVFVFLHCFLPVQSRLLRKRDKEVLVPYYKADAWDKGQESIKYFNNCNR